MTVRGSRINNPEFDSMNYGLDSADRDEPSRSARTARLRHFRRRAASLRPAEKEEMHELSPCFVIGLVTLLFRMRLFVVFVVVRKGPQSHATVQGLCTEEDNSKQKESAITFLPPDPEESGHHVNHDI